MFLWSKNSYRRTLFAWLIGYSLLLSGCVMVYQYRREKQFKVEELNAELQLVNTAILDDLDEDTPPKHLHIARQPFGDMRISVISPDGRVVYDTSLDSLPSSNHLTRAEIAQAVNSGKGYTIRRHSESTGQWYFYSASRGRNGWVVRTAVPYSVSLSRFLKADYGFLWFMVALTVAMCVAAYFLTRRLGQHISRLNDFARGVERGDKISDSAPFAHDELGDISNHIVRLYARLQKAYADRDREHRAAMHESREKERMKKRLTNNINHELKTPVASIRVCLETLLAHDNMNPDKRREFLQRCMTNADRMSKLLSDVSTITRMDDGSETIAREPVDLSRIVREVCDDCTPAAASKSMEINVDIPPAMPFTGNPSLLFSAFHNLVDNAVAYSGATRIDIAMKLDDKNLTIIVADNGCGVAPEHLPHIFERFYRIDAGRSRALGGTGLGLSIVKNAIRLHGGTISVTNRPTGGLEFKSVFKNSC